MASINRLDMVEAKPLSRTPRSNVGQRLHSIFRFGSYYLIRLTVAANGRPLDVNSLTSLGQVAFEAAAAFLAAHGSYSPMTSKTSVEAAG
ncbi:MAG: hypothetical protein WA738_09300 [Candidatus Angelobacter sp.]